MRRIAVVEDNPVNRLLVRTILENRFDVVEYETGAAALDGLSRHPPELVLLDIFLPDIDGPAVLRSLRADPALANIPVIALTGNDKPGDRERFLIAGFTDYVVKSLTAAEVLLDTIERHLSPERV
jgi:CheY-like chemotaxis protein